MNWPHHLPIYWPGPSASEPVFVTGHPGTTERLLTVAQFDSQRAALPLYLLWGSELRGRHIEFGQGGAENARIVSDRLQAKPRLDP